MVLPPVFFIDLFCCAASGVFKGSVYSSFSDAVAYLRSCHGCASERDEHRVLEAPGREEFHVRKPPHVPVAAGPPGP